MSSDFYLLDKLTDFNLEINLDDLLIEPKVEDIFSQLNELSLHTFKTATFGTFRTFYHTIGEFIPSFSYDYTSKNRQYASRIGIFANNIKFAINMTESSMVLMPKPKSTEEDVKKISETEIKNFDTDFNYLLGTILGLFKKPNILLNVSGDITCSCESLSYEKVFNNVTSLTTNIFNKNEYKINGLLFKYVEMIDNIEYALNTRIGKFDKDDKYKINYSFKSKSPIIIYQIIISLLSEMNNINNILEIL